MRVRLHATPGDDGTIFGTDVELCVVRMLRQKCRQRLQGVFVIDAVLAVFKE
jgi:hypothetical protein